MIFTYQARCLNVVDGDTIDVEIDLGFRLSAVKRVRLARIDTPERGKAGAAQATAFTRAFCIVASDPPTGWPLLITTIKPQDKYGRWLAEVRRDGVELSAELLQRKLARLYGS